MVGRPQRSINANSLAAQEAIVLDLTNWQHLQALPDDIGIVTSLSSVCLAGALPLHLAASAMHPDGDAVPKVDCNAVKGSHQQQRELLCRTCRL
jgi:hypothetical protein